MIRIILCIFLVAVGCALLFIDYSVLENRKSNMENDLLRIKRLEEENNIYNLYNKLSSSEDCEKLLNLLVENKNEKLISKIKLKLAFFSFQEAESFLFKAQELYYALDKNSVIITGQHPVVQEYLDKSFAKYELVKNICDDLTNLENDDDFNYSYFYLKGVVYYRYLEMFSNDQTKIEFFNTTIDSYKAALNYRDGDVNTTINIEILIKNLNKLMGGNDGNTPQPRNNRMLNQVGSSILRGN